MAGNSAAARAALALAGITVFFDLIIIGLLAYASSMVGDRDVRIGPTYITISIGSVYRGSWAFYSASSVLVLFISACSSLLFTIPLIVTAAGDGASMEVTKTMFFGVYHIVLTFFMFASCVSALAFFADSFINRNVNCIIAGASFGIFSCIFHAFAALAGLGRPRREAPGSREDP